MVTEANYDMKAYLDMAEKIAKKKLEMYSKLLGDISDFKRKFADELWICKEKTNLLCSWIIHKIQIYSW